MVEMFMIQQRSPIWPQMGNRATKTVVPIAPLGQDGLRQKSCHVGRHVGWMVIPAGPKYKALGPDLEKYKDPIGANFETNWPAFNPAPV